MAYLPQSPFQKRRNYLLTGEGGPEYSLEGDTRVATAPLTGSGGRSGSLPTFGTFGKGRDYQKGKDVGAGGATASTQPVQTQPVQSPVSMQDAEPLQAPEPLMQPPSFQTSGSLQQRLFQPFQEGAEKGQESLGETVSYFQQEAGPSRTYESIGAQGDLRRAVTGGEEHDLERARQLLGAEYGGPAGLQQENVAALQNLLDQMRTRKQALGSGGGLQTILQQSIAGLTPGEARFEARRRLPEVREQARDIGFETISPLAGRLATERREAQEFAKQREAEEAGIAQKSRGFLTGERGEIEQDLAQKIAEARAQQELAQEQYSDIVGASLEDQLKMLRVADPELAAQFDTEARKKSRGVDKLFDMVMSDPKYAAIKDIGPLGMTITGRGKRFYSADDKDLRAVEPDKERRKLLYERQKELEDLFSSRKYTPFRSKVPVGEYSAFKPLYETGVPGFKPLDIVPYLNFDPGMSPTQENVSSETQREQFNRIQDLLGNLDKIGEAEPFRAAQIFAEVDGYLEDEKAKLDAIKGRLSERQKKWASLVHRARKKARHAKRKKEYAQIGQVIGSVVGTYTPLSAVGGAWWGPLAGREIGEELA